jgi:regulatory protein
MSFTFRKPKKLSPEEAEDYRSAMDAALSTLKFRARSEAEIHDRLRVGGFSTDTVTNVVRRLRELNLLDDSAVARQWAENRRRAGQGEFKIRQALKKRGIPRELTDEAVREEKGEEFARAWDVLLKRAARIKTGDSRALYRRLGGFLARRGFPADVVHETLEKYFSRRHVEDE